MRNAIIAVIVLLAAVAIVIGIYFDLLACITLLVGFGVFIGLILFAVVSGVVLILAVPYYLAVKKPKIEEFGNYRLEDVQGKGEDAKEEGEREI